MAVCPLCLEFELTGQRSAGTADPFDFENSCPRCGHFIYPRGPDASGVGRAQRHLASAFVRRQNSAHQVPRFRWEQFGNADWWLQFERMGFPRTVPEKLDALLRLIGARTSLDGEMDWQPAWQTVIAELAPINEREVGRLVNLLAELSYIDARPSGSFRINARGYQRLSDLEGADIGSDAVFVAMWFSEETALYRSAAVAGIKAAGYAPVIVDQIEYNGFIVDRILASIRDSRCVIADFTSIAESDDAAKPKIGGGARGGVYWEAGYAYGLKKQVIHTCRRDHASLRRTHFDIEQYNTVFWTPDDLETDVRAPVPGDTTRVSERIFQRLIAVVGMGPSGRS